MLVPFLTLCSSVCPMTTGNLLQLQQSLQQAGDASKVVIVELSVDPERDTPARLAAYAKLTGATWEQVTESGTTLAAFSRFFGFLYLQVRQEQPAAIDWLTHQRLVLDVDHSNGYALIDPEGYARFGTGAAPDFHGKLNPILRRFLSRQGLQNLLHPSATAWTPDSALAAISWLVGARIPSAGS